METVIEVVDDVSEEENRLAEKLRSCCTSSGVERQLKLKETASILLDMGKFYREKAERCSGITQKFTFVKCAALICGAKVRFEKYVFDKRGEYDCGTAFKKMSATLLRFCKAEIQDANVLQISEKIGLQLKQFREEERAFLERNLPAIGDDESSDVDTIAKERDRIQHIRNILRANTKCYKAMMTFVSEQCVEIIGKPPCNFCLAGLGSMAREEVTLYSDFEHVILLENGIDDSPNGEIREYFRWYSVLFHVVIIGLGETYIPTVGVKSLNDLYTENKDKCWYFDHYTPGGVSFDGRFPHACKTPLGKQEPSVYRKHVVELIQPVEKMVNFLTKEENLKNGYHLSEVLARTCFVHGDQDLWTKFHKMSREHIVARNPDQTIGQTLNQKVVEQAEFVVKEINSLLNLSSMDLKKQGAERIKDLLYRPVTLLVGCLSQLFFCPHSCSLDFFPWLRKLKVLAKYAGYLHNLEYAVAVACEIRLKVYALDGQQRQNITGRDVSKFIGRRCLAKSFHAVYTIASVFDSSCRENLGMEGFLRKFLSTALSKTSELADFFEARISELFGYYEGALDIYSRAAEQGRIVDTPLHIYFMTGLACPDKREKCFARVEELFTNGDESSKSPLDALLVSHIYFIAERHQEALDLLEEWTRNLHIHSQNMERKQLVMLERMKAYESLKFITPQQRTKEDFFELLQSVSQILSRINRGYLYLQDRNLFKAKLAFRDLIELCKTNMSHLALQIIFIQSAAYIFHTQFDQEWLEDAASTLDFLDMFQSTEERNSDIQLYMDWIENLPSMKRRNWDLKKLIFTVQLYKKRNAKNPTDSYDLLVHALGLVLAMHEIPEFNEISQCFTDVPEEIFHCPNMYNCLLAIFKVHSLHIFDNSSHIIGKYMMDLFTVFREHFHNPLFIGTFQAIVNFVVIHALKITPDIKKDVMKHESGYAYGNTGGPLYDEALSHYAGLDLIKSASILWKLVNGRRIPTTLKNKSCMFLTHMIQLAPFATLMRYLIDQRPALVKRLSFPPITDACVTYNEAVSKLVEQEIKFCATDFWKVIHATKIGSSLQKRSIEMIMFSILLKWDCDGFFILIGKKYVYNEKTKNIPSAHAVLGDLYSYLPGVLGKTSGRDLFSSQVYDISPPASRPDREYVQRRRTKSL